MHEDYIKMIRCKVLASRRAISNPEARTVTTLEQICLKAISKHIDVLQTTIFDLPTSRIKDLLPQLNIIDLDRIQPALKLKGISTSCEWIRKLRMMTSRVEENGKLTEDDWRQKALSTLFHLAFFGYSFRGETEFLLDVNFNSLLLVLAKYVKHLNFFGSQTQYACTFITDQRPVLSILEATVRSILMHGTQALSKAGPSCGLYILHRLLDHGTAGEIELRNPDPTLLTWIVHGRRSPSTRQRCPTKGKRKRTFSHGERNARDTQNPEAGVSVEGEKVHVSPCKRPKLTFASLQEVPGAPSSYCQCMDPEHLCQSFTPSTCSTGQTCPQGQIHSLKMTEITNDIILPVLLPLLSTWQCLRSLSLSSLVIFHADDVFSLAESLKQLSGMATNSLTDLSVGTLPTSASMVVLLDACPNLRSFSVEISGGYFLGHHQTQLCQSPGQAGLLLENLSVKLPQMASNPENLALVLKRCPNLISLHVSGMPSGSSNEDLLITVTESNQCLRKLSLEYMNLSDCHSAIFNLLGNCMLEELTLKDCRLLEKCSEKDVFVQQLIGSLKKITSLKALNLSENRLAKNVPALGELFTGTSPSTLKELDLSRNFILPPALLELARVLQSNHPPQQMVLDLRFNPLDRDPTLRDRAIHILKPLCHLLTDSWNSRTTLADHISSM